MKTVWILGAGFSKSLGGPLLPDLLSAASNHTLLAHYPTWSAVDSHAAKVARQLYLYGCDFKAGRIHPKDPTRGEMLWEHAEDFLESLGLAMQSEPRKRRIMAAVVRALDNGRGSSAGVTVENLSAAARLLIAAECSVFLDGNETDSEKWLPCRRWVNALDSNDTIVTFNYDRVLERFPLSKLSILRIDGSNVSGPQHGYARVLKLHGSVGWCREDGEGAHRIVDKGDDFRPSSDEPGQLVIATPGPNKHDLTKEGGLLEPLWDVALRAIGEADDIVFVGYRFPPSDAYAREKLLGAIKQNPSNHLQIRVVLGPNPGDEHVVRMLGLLQGFLSHRAERGSNLIPDLDLEARPFYAEDFLALFEPAKHSIHESLR